MSESSASAGDAAGGASAAARLLKLQRVADAALAHLLLPDLLGELVARVREALEADGAAILLLDGRTGDLVLRAASGLGEGLVGARPGTGGDLAARVAAERRAIALEEVTPADGELLAARGIGSLVGAPLVSGGRVLGVVEVGSLGTRRFGPADVELLELVADRAALALERALEHEAERALAERLRKLQSVNEAALAHLAVDALLDELLVRVREIFGADTCAILLLDEERQELVARAASGLEEEVERGVRLPLGRGFAGRIAALREVVVIEDLDRADVLNPILREKGIKSMLGAPLLARGRVLGVIHVGMLRRHLFGEDDVELIQLAAERAAMGLERALLHEELIQLDRVKHRFISIASHELRTPTTSILGAAETLERLAGRLDAETEARLRAVLVGQSRRLASLIDQLLDLSRLEAQAVQIRPERLRVRERLEAIAGSVSPEGAAAVRIDTPEELEIEVDPAVFERIVSNLVVNAFRHGAPPITVSAACHDRHLRLSVEDRGPGIAPEFQARIFEQFVRTPDAAARPGSGLGLAIARSYAQTHGGDVVYEDAHPGARFRLVLPASPRHRPGGANR